MTKSETTFEWPEPIPGWDMLKWKDETQLQIYEEIKDMTTTEMIEYFRKAAKRAENRRSQKQVEIDSL